MARWDISFGKVTYAPGAPKNAPRWVWVCDCDKCQKLDFMDKVRGPFKTRREAERNAESVIAFIVADTDGQRH